MEGGRAERTAGGHPEGFRALSLKHTKELIADVHASKVSRGRNVILLRDVIHATSPPSPLGATGRCYCLINLP